MARKRAVVVALITFFLLILGAVIYVLASRNHQVSVTQGIKGVVVEKRGNCMPPTPCPDYPISATIRIYTAFSNRDDASKNLVATVISNDSGEYAASLPPGEYSVIPIQDGEERCATYDSNGTLCHVTVGVGFTEYKVEINNAVW